jgi:hypothetical protein
MSSNLGFGVQEFGFEDRGVGCRVTTSRRCCYYCL